MIAGDPNIQIVEVVVAALGDLRDELVLVGGCAASLLIESPLAAPPRVTYDVDLIASVTALKEYHALEGRFAAPLAPCVGRRSRRAICRTISPRVSAFERG